MFRRFGNAVDDIETAMDLSPNISDRKRKGTPRSKRTVSRTTVEYIPSVAPPLFQLGDWRKMDLEVGKAHHMRVACRRHYVVGAIPGRQYYASPLSLPLTHPQPC